jgi:hypothetical protein
MMDDDGMSLGRAEGPGSSHPLTNGATECG